MLDRIMVATSDSSRLRDLHFARLRLAVAEADNEKILSSSAWLMDYPVWPDDKWRFGLIRLGALLNLNKINEATSLEDSIRNSGVFPDMDSEYYNSFVKEYVKLLIYLPNRANEALSLFETTFPDTISFTTEDKYILSQLELSVGNVNAARKILDSISYDDLKDNYEALIGVGILKGITDYYSTGRLPAELLVSMPKRINYKQNVESDDRIMALNTVYLLDSQNDQLQLNRQHLSIVILSLTVLLLAVGITAYLTVRRRREKLVEAEERIDTLISMLDEVSVRAEESNDRRTLLRKTFLQQIGILKTFAGAPTAQNHDALKKISNVGKDGEKIDSLVDWEHFYSMIDELYDGFHSGTTDLYPNLTEKEIQIICLLKSGFSTKEIGVLTSQSSATIYVRKTSIRKKLSTPADGDFIAQLNGILSDESDR